MAGRYACRFSRFNRQIVIFLLILFSFSLQVRADSGSSGVLSGFTVFETDLRSVFRDLAKRGEINLLLDPAVTGIVSINFKDGLTVREAVELLARTYGYKCIWRDDRTVMVGNEKTPEILGTEELKAYELKYLRTEEAVEALKIVIPRERIGVDDRTNLLAISGSALEHYNIEEILKALDREKPQYIIEVGMVEITENAARQLGFDRSFQDLSLNGPLRLATADHRILQRLEAENEAWSVISTSFSAREGKEGQIFIGDKYPVIFTRITEKGLEERIEYKEVGVDLKLLPRLTGENIVLTIQAEVSSIVDWKKSAGESVPVTQTNTAGFVKRLREGETCLLSGFKLIDKDDKERAAPVISKLPLVGKLLQGKGEGPRRESAVCLFLTPRITGYGKEESVADRTTVGPGDKERLPGEEKAKMEETPGEFSFQPEITTEIINITPKTAGASSGAAAGEGSPGGPKSAGPVEKEAKTGTVVQPDIEVTIIDQSGAELSFDGDSWGISGSGTDSEGAGEGGLTTSEPPVGLKITYRVKKGDTVYAIARKYGISPESVLRENSLTKSSLLSVGEALTIPIPFDHLYPINSQETLWRIAKRYGLDVNLLMEINSISDATTVKTGQVIILPVPIDRVVNKDF